MQDTGCVSKASQWVILASFAFLCVLMTIGEAGFSVLMVTQEKKFIEAFTLHSASSAVVTVASASIQGRRNRDTAKRLLPKQSSSSVATSYISLPLEHSNLFVRKSVSSDRFIFTTE